MASLPDLLALLVQSAVRGASGGSRQCVAAATAAAIRVAAEVFLGIEAPSDTVLEAKERLGVIKHVITKRVEAGAEGLRANLPGAVRKARNRAEHHAFGAGPGAWRSLSACPADASGLTTVMTTGQNSEFDFSDGRASDATGCSKNLALGVEAPGISDPVPVKIQDLPLDQIPDHGLGASHSGNPVVDVGAPGFIDPAQVKNQVLLPDKVPDSNYGAPQAAMLDHVKATSQAVPALTLDVVADDTVDDRMANSNLHRKPPDKVKHSAEIKKELAAIDRTIKKNTRDFERIGKLLRQPSGLSTEQVASLRQEQASGERDTPCDSRQGA